MDPISPLPKKNSLPESYWEQAGSASYAEAMYSSEGVERHIRQRSWNLLTDVGLSLGMTPQSRILDLGCGDGAFANQQLAKFFTQVEGYDLSVAGIERANTQRALPDFHFHTADLTTMDYASLTPYDGVFMVGILHHVKPHAAAIVKALRHVAPRVVVLEPNGMHPARKLLELTPSYRRAGEQSFSATAVVRMFEDAGYELKRFHRQGLFPNFTPPMILRALKPLEEWIEASRILSLSCTASVFGFVRK
uniref:S-adenosylmethionine-dependent methyltransferase n=1 Tax=uncultured bacterium CSL1 TaxID=1091565 RepID=G4WVB5_9BACT|nr:S-adenosylmethionine-dependent methyltransferase [uncultured bacterium CSL1]